MVNGPLVSVLMPVYNMRAYIRSALESIQGQSYKNLEIIIVDDGSTDGSSQYAREIADARVRIVSQPNSGRAAAMNTGLDLVRGDFFLAQDADDVSRPDRVENQLRYLVQHPQIAAAFCGYDLIIGEKLVAPSFSGKTVAECKSNIEEFRMPGHGPTPMYRTEMVSDFRFEPSLVVAEDLDYILQIGERYPLSLMSECLYSYRVNRKSSSRIDPGRNFLMEQLAHKRACLRRGLASPPETAMPSKSIWFGHRRREAVVPHFMESVLDLRRAGCRRASLETALFCAQLHPFDPYYYKPLAYFLAPLRLIDAHRSR